MQPPASSKRFFLLFTGNANRALAAEIARNLGTELGAADV
ncbi:MAG: ribose-phosphate pyrophosphokinase, partial [Limnohabitans sp.]